MRSRGTGRGATLRGISFALLFKKLALADTDEHSKAIFFADYSIVSLTWYLVRIYCYVIT